MDKSLQKINVLKRCLGRKYVILNQKENPFLAEIIKIVDGENVIVKDNNGETFESSIFDIRNPNQEL